MAKVRLVGRQESGPAIYPVDSPHHSPLRSDVLDVDLISVQLPCLFFLAYTSVN
jgi:hypothetical protein